jgi:hypothetical protein
VTRRAGATASVDCGLCKVGTYGTGSGEGLRTRLGFDCDLHVIHALLLPISFVYAPDRWLVGFGSFSMLFQTSCLCVRRGVQARQQASTAACARLGPMGLDQVRVSE